jgi:CrcB protein
VSAAVVAAVLLAGAIGALARYGVSRLNGSNSVENFPWAVLVVNVVGSAIGGAVLGLAYSGVVSADWRLILFTGFCGGLTTFSTFSVETVQLVIDGRTRVAIGSVAANLVLGVAAAAIGFLLTR